MAERIGDAVAERGAEFSRLGLPPRQQRNPARARTAAARRRGRRRRSAAACGTKRRCETVERARRSRRAASRVTIENSPSRQGVVRAIAWSDHWRWVSTPRWSRTSRKVTSTCQRWTNQRTICSGSLGGIGAEQRLRVEAPCRDRAAAPSGSARPAGPLWRQTAVAEQISTIAVALAVPAGHGDPLPARGLHRPAPRPGSAGARPWSAGARSSRAGAAAPARTAPHPAAGG